MGMLCGDYGETDVMVNSVHAATHLLRRPAPLACIVQNTLIMLCQSFVTFVMQQTYQVRFQEVGDHEILRPHTHTHTYTHTRAHTHAHVHTYACTQTANN